MGWTLARKLRIPTRDLIADLIVEPDACLGDPEGLACRAMPRHMRLYVAGFMLSDGTPEGDARCMREAYDLYDRCGSGLLDQQRKLTTADVVAEVLQLVDEEQS
jgi:hypothetical protein